MPVSNLEINTPFNLIAKNEIENLRQKYERDYARAHDEALNLASAAFFNELATVMTFSINNNSFAASRFKQAAKLVTQFINQYQEVYSSELGEVLKRLRNFFNAYQMLFEAWALLDSGYEQTDTALEYTQICKGYQLLGELVNKYWEIFSVDIRNEFEESARAIQNKTGFGSSKSSWDELKQSWRELRQQLSLFGASIRSGSGDLFKKYKRAVIYFTSSVFEKVDRDEQLQDFKESQKIHTKQSLESPHIYTNDEQRVYIPITELARVRKNKELIELLKNWREEDSRVNSDSHS